MSKFQEYLEEEIQAVPKTGYVHTMQGIDLFKNAIRDLKKSFIIWKEMPMTVNEMHEPAIKELIVHIRKELLKEFKNKKE